jgi:hypothetical protein
VDQRADDFFRVMDIHLAAEGFKIEGFVTRHGFEYNPWSFSSR